MPARKVDMRAFMRSGVRPVSPPCRSSGIRAAAFRHHTAHKREPRKARMAQRLSPPLPRWLSREATDSDPTIPRESSFPLGVGHFIRT